MNVNYEIFRKMKKPKKIECARLMLMDKTLMIIL